MSDIEVREMEIFDWKKKVTEAECKLKQQENLLESVVSERNLYSKNLIETQVVVCSHSASGRVAVSVSSGGQSLLKPLVSPGGDRRAEEEIEDHDQPGDAVERRDNGQGADRGQGPTGAHAPGEGQ